MRRPAALFLACLMIVATGCSARTQRSQPPQPPAPAPAPGGDQAPAPGGEQAPGGGSADGPDFMAPSNPFQFSPEQLGPGLVRYLSQPGRKADARARLDDLFTRWQLRPRKGELLHAEADLDGDGTAEVITALNGAGPAINGTGGLFVLRLQNGRWSATMSETLPGAALHAVADLTGDGRPEIVWSSLEMGAHTGNSTVFVSGWQPDQGLAQLPGGRFFMSSMEFERDGADLLLNGGLIASVGAGDLQRPRTDRYRWKAGEFRMVDRRFAPSELGYSLLIDALTAEAVGRTDDAVEAYREAMDPGRAAFRGDSVPPEWGSLAPDAVRAFARTRLALLLLQTGQSAEARRVAEGAEGAFAELPKSLPPFRDNIAACAKVEAYAESVPDFLDALNSPTGYANPQWHEGDVCGPLPRID